MSDSLREKRTATDQRLRNYIFDLWFYPVPSGMWGKQFMYPAPGYCRFVEFTAAEILLMQKEHDAS